MAHFAKVKDGKVIDLIVAEPEFFDTFVDTTPGEWIQTSYNTHGGEHPQNTPLSYNFAQIGGWYNRTVDAFYSVQPYPSWTLDTATYVWIPPVAYPDADSDEVYYWNEETTSWQLVD